MFITFVPQTRAMRYARALCYISKRVKEEMRKEREGGEGESMRFHVTGNTMTLYVSLNISHRRANRG